MKLLEQLSIWASPALLASITLVAIQVSIGLLFKSVQVKGGYSFSTSASIAISEFLKLTISTTLFYWRSSRSNVPQDTLYSPLRSDEPIPFKDLSAAAGSRQENKPNGALLEEPSPPVVSNGETLPDQVAFRWKRPKLTIRQSTRDFLDQLSTPTVIGYGQLALLYALINNTVFVLFRLADPGTINLIKSGITLATALTSMIFLGSNIAKLQWAAIGFQICGLILSQYHPDSGSIYPIPTYAVLLGQTFVAAIAGVFNQHLLKTQSATLHAQNMVLYSFGMVTNTVIHLTIKIFKPEEPGFFEGYGNIGALLVIVSSVLNGLIITAIYKYADAITKCFATAISTAILLYLAPLLFHTNFSFLMLPGTVIVFIATWMYVETAPPKTQASTEELSPMPLEAPKASFAKRMISSFTPWGSLAAYGLTVTTIMAVSSIVALNTWDIRGMQSVMTQNSGGSDNSTSSNSSGIRSPFANTVGFLRLNSHFERLPTLAAYEPFFHTLHYSVRPGATPEWPSETTVNLTHSTWDDHMTVYMPVADLMRLILSDEKYSAIDGLLNFHFDVWLNPMEFGNMDFSRAWLPNGRNNPTWVFDEANHEINWDWWNKYELWKNGVKSLNALNGTIYQVDKIQVTYGFVDLYYIPRRYFKDFIYLTELWYPQFHETAVPTMMDVLDRAYRKKEGTRQVLWLADCWGNTTSINPPMEAILYERCGHRFAMNNPEQVKAQFGRLERQAALLRGETPLPTVVEAKHDQRKHRRREFSLYRLFEGNRVLESIYGF